MQIRHTISNHFVNTLPKFTGTVEIDETNFFKKKIALPGRAGRCTWVFGLWERESRQTYMEIVPVRTAAHLLPIIQKRCEVGTTIISD